MVMSLGIVRTIYLANLQRKNREDMDITEVLDEYSERVYGHTNWGYTSTYSKEELADKLQYDLELDNAVVFWNDPIEEEE